jgi:NAD(P)-dependent dehydrogenase (short-subunit alcohol dehydrogenase family)
VFILGGAPQYTASKHGVVALMRTVAWPYAKFGVKVAAVAPWFAGACACLVLARLMPQRAQTRGSSRRR